MYSLSYIAHHNKKYNTSFTRIKNLGIGDVHWADKNTLITTILGSCISICVWHPEAQIGGMCHFKLSGKKYIPSTEANHGYGYDAIQYLVNKINSSGFNKDDFIISIYGGSSILPASSNLDKSNIGEKNSLYAKNELNRLKFKISHEDIGGKKGRKLRFNLNTGEVDVSTN